MHLEKLMSSVNRETHILAVYLLDNFFVFQSFFEILLCIFYADCYCMCISQQKFDSIKISAFRDTTLEKNERIFILYNNNFEKLLTIW